MPLKLNLNKAYTIETCLDYHTAGEPLRIVVDGVAEPKGHTMIEKRQYMRENFDSTRRLLMFESREHKDRFGALLTQPERSDSDVGVLFMHNEGYSSMCGHGTLALMTEFVVSQLVSSSTSSVSQLAIDSPAAPFATGRHQYVLNSSAPLETGLLLSV